MRVYSVDPSDPFLATLAERIREGTLWPDGVLPDDPFALADVTIYLPTRRAARTLAAAFLEGAGNGATLLPRIEALGEAEDEAEAKGEVMDVLEARVVLAQLIRAWAGVLESAEEAEPGARVLVPSAGPDAVRLADDLIALMDQVETQEADWANLPGLVERADLAEHWQITTRFLEIATRAWPDHVTSVGRMTAATARRLEAHAAVERVGRAKGPIIVAGSTGSLPATRRMIRAIGESPWGAVVLPGFDRAADDAAWSALAGATDAPGHPQYGMRLLVETLGIAPGDVRRLAPITPSPVAPERTAMLSAALRPAPDTGRWLADRAAIDLDVALDGVAMIEAADEREEAQAIAVAMRRSVANGETVALITPHRPLARRVIHALRRWEIEVDDSAGDPISTTPAGILARLVASIAFTGGAADWLALLKHPWTTFGVEPDAYRAGVHSIERMFRGPRLAPGRIIAAMRAPVKGRDAAAAIAGEIEAALAPLRALKGETVTIAALAAAHLDAFARVAPDAPEGADLAAVKAALGSLSARDELAIAPVEWPATFDALVSGIVVRGAAHDHAVRILGPLEARLQAFDHTILGGLNEGTWPQLPDAGPWMSRGMMSAFGIEQPERRIGLSAHDFVMAAHQKRVTLTRAAKAAGEPTVASRWWLRIAAFAGEAIEPAKKRGAALVALAAHLDARPPVDPPARPMPAPPLESRPRLFRVTEIARLVRDPYAIYARRVLGLEPLDPLEADPSAGDRGELFHAVLARFIEDEHHRAPDAVDQFHRLVAEALKALDHAPDAQALWGARLKFIAARICEEEARRAPRVVRSLVEVPGEMALSSGVSLRGRIDRIDVFGDGSIELIDYKSGRPPSVNEVKTFFEPQLPLEAALVKAGAITALSPDAPIDELTYVALARGRVPVDWVPVAKGEAMAYAEEAMERLTALLALYEDAEQGYVSRARPQNAESFDGDYDHLARAAEWQNG
ncbi:double-strand break repair protein AddB [Acuticoccus sp. M5D2P5]|uniref:double-strand break repair protein AddB n=1 Tax=Acuticoccus kalidii TaxID=2910977 RepID=UPI001F234D7E|nr:double-strand break repair protein AddB [Acuticoccus kalidii]MCF3933911.1 double-strand break repair protein AddB [Acuticoccus kalidii]